MSMLNTQPITAAELKDAHRKALICFLVVVCILAIPVIRSVYLIVAEPTYAAIGDLYRWSGKIETKQGAKVLGRFYIARTEPAEGGGRRVYVDFYYLCGFLKPCSAKLSYTIRPGHRPNVDRWAAKTKRDIRAIVNGHTPKSLVGRPPIHAEPDQHDLCDPNTMQFYFHGGCPLVSMY